MDTQSPQELAEVLWDKCSEHIDDSSFGFEQVAGTSVAKERNFIEVVTEALSTKDQRIAELENPWIFLTDRLPEVGEYVWMCAIFNDEPVVLQQPHCRYNDGTWHTQMNGLNSDYDMLCWMPYPEPPKK